MRLTPWARADDTDLSDPVPGSVALVLCLLAMPLMAQSPPTPATRIVHRADSAFSTIYVVEDVAGTRRCLRFGQEDGLQSCMLVDDPTHLALPYTRSLVAVLALAESPRRVLMIGLGGASIPRFLARFFPEVELDAVEIDPEIVSVAARYFQLEPGARTRVHVADGADFLARSRESWDVILVDATFADSVPDELTSAEFFAALASHLAPGGVVAMNLLAPANEATTAHAIESFRAAFPAAAALLSQTTRMARAGLLPKGIEMPAVNHILVGRADTVDCPAWATAAAALTATRGLSADLGAVVTHECSSLGEIGRGEEAP